MSNAVKDEMDDFEFLMNESFERKNKSPMRKNHHHDETLSGVGGVPLSNIDNKSFNLT